MIELQLYKYKYKSNDPNLPEREFNFFSSGRYMAGIRDGVDIVDCIRITDCLDDIISDVDLSIRDREDIRVYETSKFTIKLDRQNDAVSEILGHNIDQFFGTEYLRKRKIFCRLFYGTRKFEGFVDIPSINWDFTWLDNKDDIEFDVDEPMQEFFQGMREVPMLKVGYNTRIPYDEYFASHHFVEFFNNGTVSQVEDKLDLQTKLQPYWGDVQKPIISGWIQSKLIDDNEGYKVYDATLSFSRGLGLVFKLESVDENMEFPLEVRPFKLTYFLETDGFTYHEIENVHVHRRAYRWYNQQHVLVPYWQLEGPTGPAIEAYYMGLFMTAEGDSIHFSDWWNGTMNPQIVKFNQTLLKDKYEVADWQLLGTPKYFWVKDTYLLDVVYPHNGLVEWSEAGTYKPLNPAYCRCIVKDYTITVLPGGVNVYSDDDGFEEIVKVTAIPAYKYLCGEFKEKLLISIDFEPSASITVGSKIKFDGVEYRVERMSGFDVAKQKIMVEAVVY